MVPDSLSHDDLELTGEDASANEKLFNLESLEPRILLSGDPVMAELARMAAVAEDDSQQQAAVIVEQLDASTHAQLIGGDFGSAGDTTEAAFAWPSEWSQGEVASAVSDTAEAVADEVAETLIAAIENGAGETAESLEQALIETRTGAFEVAHPSADVALQNIVSTTAEQAAKTAPRAAELAAIERASS